MPLPVITVEQMRQWEKQSWTAGKTAGAVIKRVGHALSQRLLTLTEPGDSILILAGDGHNGDDARAAIPHLARRRVFLIEPGKNPERAAIKFTRLVETQSRNDNSIWIVDGLFGIGLNRPLEGSWRNFVETINASALPVLSVDTPSGLNAENGAVEGVAVRADITFTIGAPKRGLLLAPKWVGRLEVAHDVGLISCPHRGEMMWTLGEDFADWPLRRPVEGNKGDFGHVTIVAGSLGFHGAAVLAARGALRARPGLVTVEPQKSVYLPVAAQLQAAMVRPWHAGQPLPHKCSAILFGPGLAQQRLPAALKPTLRSHWKKFPGAMVVDASALDWLVQGGGPSPGVRVVTPHPGEAARFLAATVEKVQADRPAALREISRRLGNCYVVLKGNHTLVGQAGESLFVNSSGNPFLAQGGSGDLLGGYLAGLLAQPACAREPLTAIRYAVWQHGASADEATRRQAVWTMEDLAETLGAARSKPAK